MPPARLLALVFPFLFLPILACRAQPESSSLRIDPEAIEFFPASVGVTSSEQLVFENTGEALLDLRLGVEAPLAVETTRLQLAPGASANVRVTFTPVRPGDFASAVRIALGDSTREIAAKAQVAEAVQCKPSRNQCRVARFDPGLGCVEELAAEGAACRGVCGFAGLCQEGSCSVALECNDGDACTTDFCKEDQALCRHSPVSCPGGNDPCQVPTCDPSVGCGITIAFDGTPCGAADGVCASGRCTQPHPPFPREIFSACGGPAGAPNFMSEPLCTGGFCWESPSPGGPGLLTASGRSTDDVWFFGRGYALHWTGRGFDPLELPNSMEVSAAWAGESDELWVSDRSGPLFLRKHGTWTQLTPPPSGVITEITGDRSDNLYFLTTIGQILHWNGTDWDGQSREAKDLWFSPTEGLFWITDDGEVLQQKVARGPVTGLPPMTFSDHHVELTGNQSELWVADSHGVKRFSFTTSRWAPMDVVDTRKLWVGADQAVRVDNQLRLHTWRADSGWTPVFSPQVSPWPGVFWANAANDVWLADEAGVLLHWDGAAWSRAECLSFEGAPEALWSDRAGTLYVATHRGVWTRRASGWTKVPFDFEARVKQIHGSGANDVWFVNEHGAFFHFDGTAITRTPLPHPGSYTTVFSVSPGLAYAGGPVGNHGVLAWDGSTWRSLDVFWGASTESLWSDGTELLAVDGTSGNVRRWSGTGWSTAYQPSSYYSQALRLRRVEGSSLNDLWFSNQYFGYSGRQVRFDGTHFSEVPHPVPSLTLLSRGGQTFSGTEDGLWKWGSAGWQRVLQSPARTLAMDEADRIWIGGLNGALLRSK